MTISNDATLQQTQEVPCTELHGDLVLMNSQTGRYHSLTGSAVAIWKMMESRTTLQEVCASVLASYAVDQATCREDVTQFVVSLAEQNLVRVVRP